MEVVHPRCAGIDISKRDAKVCVRIAGAGRRKASETVTTWGSMSRQILALRDHLADEGVTCVVMEATGDYWKPFYYLLEDLPGVEVMLVNARHVKNLPGRKTDVGDATWLAQLGAHGLVRGSFVPPEPVRQLRDLTRTRTAITRERSREAQRLEKLLEDAGIKLSAVASDILGVSGRAMLEALIAGDRDPARMADLARRRMRSKIPELTEALAGRFTSHHAFLARVHLDLIDQHTAAIGQITARIEEAMEPFRAFRKLICSIPGISTLTADVVVAESGSPGALPHRGPLRTVRAPHRRTRLKQAPRTLRAGVLATCVCGPEARGGRRRVSSGFEHRPACRACPGGRGSRRQSPCGPRSATTVPSPLGTGAGRR
jgi:transposase